MPTTLTGIDEVRANVGQELGVSSWYLITQERIDAFAEATGDHYWIHTSPEKAAATPLGSTIAHGLLTLALGPMFNYEIVTFDGFAMMLNYARLHLRVDPAVHVDG